MAALSLKYEPFSGVEGRNFVYPSVVVSTPSLFDDDDTAAHLVRCDSRDPYLQGLRCKVFVVRLQ